jgi:O-antigen/teichoic acid export membrane protein
LEDVPIRGVLPDGHLSRAVRPTIWRALVTKSAVYGLGASLNGLAQFLLIPFYTRHLGASDYGRFALAEMALNLLLVVLALGLQVALLARYQRCDAEQRTDLVRAVFGFVLVSVTIGLALFLGLARVLGPVVLPTLPVSRFYWVAAIGGAETLWLLFATLFRAQGAAWRYIGGWVIQVTAGLGATVILIREYGLRDDGILAGRLIGAVVVLVSLSPTLYRYRPYLDIRRAWPVVRLGLPLLPAALASMLVAMAPRYFVEIWRTTADVGIYAMSSKMAGVISIGLVQPFALGWLPIMFQVYERSDARIVYGRVITYYLLIGLGLAFGLGLAAPLVFRLIEAGDFQFDAWVLVALCLANVLAGLMHAVNIGPYVRERTGAQVPVLVATAAVAIALCAVLTGRYGVRGAALGLAGSYLFQAVLLHIVSQRLYPIVVQSRRLTAVLTAVTVAFALASQVPGDMTWPLMVLLRGAGFLFVAVAVLWVTGFFGPPWRRWWRHGAAESSGPPSADRGEVA